MNLILLGAPGSGKGTQAEYLVRDHNFKQFSTGDLMRAELAQNSALGQECARYMNAGQLVPDTITNQLVQQALQAEHDQLIFDGYPRTHAQAVAIDEMLGALTTQIDRVVYIEVATDVLVARIANRIICPQCKRSYNLANRRPQREGVCDFDATPLVRRPDDDPAKVAVRLAAYKADTAPLVGYYQQQGLLVTIEATDLTSEEVYATLQQELGL